MICSGLSPYTQAFFVVQFGDFLDGGNILSLCTESFLLRVVVDADFDRDRLLDMLSGSL